MDYSAITRYFWGHLAFSIYMSTWTNRKQTCIKLLCHAKIFYCLSIIIKWTKYYNNKQILNDTTKHQRGEEIRKKQEEKNDKNHM